MINQKRKNSKIKRGFYFYIKSPLLAFKKNSTANSIKHLSLINIVKI
jgi:hypothetical protein